MMSATAQELGIESGFVDSNLHDSAATLQEDLDAAASHASQLAAQERAIAADLEKARQTEMLSTRQNSYSPTEQLITLNELESKKVGLS